MPKKIICIAGTYSGCGKTTIAELLLKTLKGNWGALKYTKTSLYIAVSDETEDPPKGKDTYRMKKAGAKKVIRIQSPEDRLEEPVQIALRLMADCDGIIAEGNSLVEFLNPDIVIFVWGQDIDKIKSSAKRLFKTLYRQDVDDIKLKDILLKASKKRKISCSIARKIAEKYNFSYQEVGKIIDELNIKITDCELGCF